MDVSSRCWLPLGDGEGEYGEVAMRAWKATLTGAAFPKLRALQFGYEAAGNLEALEGLWTSPLCKRLERVRFSRYPNAALFVLAERRCSKQLTVELDFGPFFFAATPGGNLELRAGEPDGHVDNVWKQLLPHVAAAPWKRVTVAAGALTEPQLAALRKQLPKADVVVS